MSVAPLHPDRIVFQSARVTVGEWRCPRTHPLFADSGPIERHLVAFPRTSAVIRHAGRSGFVADARLATVYNRGQRYTREAVHPDGDRCDWWAVDPDTAREIAASVDRHAGTDDDAPLRFAHAPVEATLYARQRSLLLRIRSGAIDTLAAEEAVVALWHDTVAAGARAAGSARATPSRGSREVAEAAARELAASWQDAHTLDSLSRGLGVSPFHLCRSFRAAMGRTLHRQLTLLRLRAALEALSEGGSDLTQVALAHGFSSHSHFSYAFRREFGLTPSQWRAQPRAIS
ncbi:helix-turn-helix transcriptional regulator [Ramlibacter sp. PS4R-6]|uniref:helix-turn-helix transcriptional regulator n=1 Tax=Ramlibacter sp. PS4R-6 TaxID=3133438 RepID=UPI0030A0B03A